MTSLLNSLENLLIPAPQASFVPTTFPKKKKKLQSLDLDEEKEEQHYHLGILMCQVINKCNFFNSHLKPLRCICASEFNKWENNMGKMSKLTLLVSGSAAM